VGSKVSFTNILFQPDAAQFLPESRQPLEILYLFMKRNPGVKIEIQGHVNSPGSDPDNKDDLKLSEGRAKAIYDYLVKKGIPSSQVTYKGYGNKHMLYPKPKNQLQMTLNRRVEILILENIR
jgi:outer membrane protein OmpA-like peptidoglycan-associated protein